MIIVNEARFGLDVFARWTAQQIRECPGHIWRRGPHDPAWMCERCPAWGQLRGTPSSHQCPDSALNAAFAALEHEIPYVNAETHTMNARALAHARYCGES